MIPRLDNLFGAMAVLLFACGPTAPSQGDDDDDSASADARPGGELCANAGGTACVGAAVYECTDDGTLGEFVAQCNGGTCAGGLCVDECPGGSELIYLVDADSRLLRFDPENNAHTFQVIGTINCPAGPALSPWDVLGPAQPYSMSVDRSGRAWVLYTSGELFWVSTADASCASTPFQPGQAGFQLFGMGFVSDDPGSSTEKLYVAGGNASMSGTGSLGVVDTGAMTLAPVGVLPATERGPELTGTGDAELFGYYPGSSTFVAHMSKATAQNEQTWALPPLSGSVVAYAFAHWGGRFYIFITTQDLLGGTSSQVHRLDPSSGSSTVVVPISAYVVVGAGVSTCAPVDIL